MDTQTQIDRLIELAIIQRSELKQLVEQLPQLREHLNAEVEKVFDETEPQLRAELEEWTTKQTADKTAALGVALEAKIADLAKSLEVSTQARYNAIIAERAENARLAAQAEAKIAEHAASLPGAVKEIVSAELARFPRAGEIDQLRKEFAEPRGLNPRGKWQAGETYNKLDLVTINGDSYTSNTDGNRTRPSRSSADWTLVAARGTGGGGGPTSLSELTTVPSDGDLLIGSGTSWVTSNLTAGAGISITVGPGAITISATDGDITLDDGTAASPSLHFTNDPDTGIYRPAANTLGISVSGTQIAYFDENGLTVPSAGVVAGGSFHGANGNANNPSFSFTSDQDTGFYRHGTNELGISIGGTEKAVMTSTTFSITPNVSTSGNLTVSGTGLFNGDVTLSKVGPKFLLTDTSDTSWSVRSSAGYYLFKNETANIDIARFIGSTLASAKLEILATTDSSSKDTGSIITEGGLGVEKSASIGGNLTVSGSANLTSSSLNSFIYDGAGWVWTSTGTGGGTVKGGIYAAGGLLHLTANSSLATNRFSLNSSGDATVAGNLTVSGTGTSSVGGSFGIGTTAPTTINGVANAFQQVANVTGSGTCALNITGTQAILSLVDSNASANVKWLTLTNSNGVSTLGVLNDAGSTTQTGFQFFHSTGNFLFGTGSDGGQKLQVSGTSKFDSAAATHTVAEFKQSNASYNTDLNLSHVSAASSALISRRASGELWLYTTGADAIKCYTNSTLALTLDSSQNATFAKKITTLGTADNSFAGRLLVSAGSNNSQEGIIRLTSTDTEQFANIGFFNGATSKNANARNWQVSTNYNAFGTLEFLRSTTNTGNPTTLVLTLDKDGDATFAGSIRQNQANNISLTSGVATTIFSLGTSAGVYIVTATLDVNAVAGYAIVGKGATGSWQVLANSGTQMSFSMSTNDLQITQSSGSTSTTNTFNLLRLR